MSACGHISFPSPSSPIQLYPAGPANVSLQLRLLWSPGAAAPLAKVTGMIVTVRVRLRAAGGVQSTNPRLRPRGGNFAGFKGVRGQFHEKK